MELLFSRFTYLLAIIRFYVRICLYIRVMWTNEEKKSNQCLDYFFNFCFFLLTESERERERDRKEGSSWNNMIFYFVLHVWNIFLCLAVYFMRCLKTPARTQTHSQCSYTHFYLSMCER